ncbi:MAG: hypothetical protein CMF23_17855 [Ignavibacteriae bacterium]|nr:hypothetical protein [Ignavibacteriota bacterium]
MLTNEQIQELIRKATISTATGGQLNTEQAKELIDLVVSQNEFLQKIQTVQMTASEYQLSLLDLNSRMLRRAVEGTAPAETFGVNITPRSLNYKETILPFDVTFSFLEENIEGNNADAKIQRAFAKQFGNDLLDLAVNGDESLAETITDTTPANGLDDTTGLSQNDHSFLRQNDGWLKIALGDSSVHDFTIPATPTYKDVFKSMFKLLPNKWRRDIPNLIFLVSPNVEVDYRAELGERVTALGDSMVTERRSAQFNGIDVVPLPFMPDNAILFTHAKNLAVGIGRAMRVGRQVQERKRVIEYTVTAKVDFNYAVSDQIVLGYK